MSVQPLTPSTVTWYIPLFEILTFDSTGFCVVDEKLEGPDHTYEIPLPECKFTVAPVQEGEELLA